MGTTLTGTTPQDTYDSLIKVTDNGPLSATAKYLSDGLGNDSALALSTTLVGVGTATPSQKLSVLGGNLLVNNGGSPDSNSGIRVVAPISTTHYNWMIAAQQNISGGFELTPSTAVGGTTFSTPALSILGASGNVGIGTSAPLSTLHLDASGGATIRLQRTSASANRFDVGTDGTNMEFNVRDTGSFTFGGSGSYLRLASGTGGIQFNGDTAAANALDDYEEGTFTPSVAFGGASVGVTYFDRIGNYTKIGRQVFVTLYLALTNSGSSTGSATIEGLPFTNGNANRGNQAVGSIRFDNITYTGTLQIFVPNSTTQIGFQQVTEAGTDSLLTQANFNGATEMSISLSYFV